MEIKKNIAKNLKKVREMSGFTQEEMARELGISTNAYRNYEIGERSLPIEALGLLAQKYKININNFLQNDCNITSLQNFNTFVVPENNDDCIEIPVRGDVSASMGFGITVYNEKQTAVYNIGKQLAHDLGINISQTEMIFASGDSMKPTIEGGDSLLVDLSKNEIYDGRIYCVRIDGQLYAKKLQKIPPNKIKVISDNEKYDPFYIDFSKEIDFDFKVIGEVRWWGRIAK